MSKERKTYDWEAIEKEYRAGQLSIREIAKTHGCSEGAIRKKMKANGIDRDLSARVAEKVRTELVRNEVRTANPATEKEIIDTAAARAVEVVRSHRKRIAAGGKIVERLFEQLEEALNNRDAIEDAIITEKEDDKSPVSRNAMLKAVSLPSHASAAVSLSLALKNLVGLDRESFNIQSDLGGTGKSLQDMSTDELLAIIKAS